MESRGKLILLLVAGLIVAFAAIAVYSRIASSPEISEAPVENKQSDRVIIARRDLPPGTFVQAPQDIDWETIPPESIKDTYLREGQARIEDYIGAVARRQLRAGEPVTQSALMKAGEGGFMSAVLEPGMRAVSVAVNATSGNAGFVSPGDRIDLIVTHHVRAGNDEVVTSEIFVHDVRVVAVDQQLDNPENKAILAKTVTVEVTPKQAEQVAVASEMGKISVALRSISTTPAQAAATKLEEEARTGEAAGEVPLTPAANDNEDAKIMTDLYGTSTADKQKEAQGFSKRVRVFRGGQVENVELY